MIYGYYVVMNVAIAFMSVRYTDLFHDFNCEIPAGASVLMLTSREEHSRAIARLVTGMSSPSHGSISVNGRDIAGFTPEQLLAHRRNIGVVPSGGGLISNLKLWENIMLPKTYHNGETTSDDADTAHDLLAALGYAGSVMASPAQLSLNERRSAAFVRAVVQNPDTMLYSHCFDGLPTALFTAFSRLAADFHAQGSTRTSLYLSGSRDLASVISFDAIISLQGFDGPGMVNR